MKAKKTVPCVTVTEGVERMRVEKLKLEVELLKTKNTNARMKQLKLVYELRKLETEMGVTPSVIDLPTHLHPSSGR